MKMLEALALDSRGEATVFGDAETRTPAVATLLNGALGHSLYFDDMHADSSPHPSAPVVPAAFAVGEMVGASGHDMLTAIVTGYEAPVPLNARFFFGSPTYVKDTLDKNRSARA